PHPAGCRSRLRRLSACLAVVAGAAIASLAAEGAQAQNEPPIPPVLQQPIPVQPGQPQPSQQPAPQQQAPQQQAPQQPLGDAAAPGQAYGDWIERCTPTPPPDAAPPRPGEQDVCFLIQQVADQDS